MKFAVVVLVLLPLALGASLDDKRFLESLLGGVDVLDLGKSIVCQFGTSETEAQCESTLCPQALTQIHITGIAQSLTCVAVCKEAQVLIQTYGSTGALGCGTATGISAGSTGV